MAAATLIDSYELHQELGTGGMATVYRALVTADRPELGLHKGDAVALKLLHPHLAKLPEFPQRFAREARVAARLIHPGVARVYENGLTVDNQPYLVMELAAGRKLGECLTRDQPFAMPRILSVLRQVASVLEAARQQGVVHRDIKPDNLLLDDQDHVKVLDFGLVRDSDTLVMISQAISMTGKALGTPAYMSPEQWHGGREVDHRTDLYALGVTAYALATGRLPFTGPTPSAFFQQHEAEIPPRIEELNPALPKGLIQVIYRLLAKAPADRYQTAGELLQDIDRIQHGQSPKVIYRFHKQRRFRLRSVAAIAGAAVLLALLVVWRWQRTVDDQARTEIKMVAADAQRLAATRDYDQALAVLKAGIGRFAAHPRLIADLERQRDDYVAQAVAEQQRIVREARDQQARRALAEVERLLAVDHPEEALRRAADALDQYHDTATAAALTEAQQQARNRLAGSTAQRDQRYHDHYQRALLLLQHTPPDLPNTRLNLQAALKEKPDADATQLLQVVITTLTLYREALRQGQEALAEGQNRGDPAAIRDALAQFRKARNFWSTTEAAELIGQAEDSAASLREATAAAAARAATAAPAAETNRPPELWRFAQQVEAKNNRSEIVRVILPSYRLEQAAGASLRLAPGIPRPAARATVAKRSYDLLDETGRPHVLTLEVLAGGHKTVKKFPGGNAALRLVSDLPPRYAVATDYRVEFALRLDGTLVTNTVVHCEYSCEDARTYDWSSLKSTLAKQIDTVVDAHPVRISLRLVNYDYDRDFSLQLKTTALPDALVPP